jgi:hypothetical protein
MERLEDKDCGWQKMVWGGDLMLSKVQKSAASPNHLLLASDF